MLDELFEKVSLLRAKRRSQHGEHFTLMAFTTHWKAMFGTPDLDGRRGRRQVAELPGFKTPEEAIQYAIDKAKRSVIVGNFSEEHIRDMIDNGTRKDMSLEIDALILAKEDLSKRLEKAQEDVQRLDALAFERAQIIAEQAQGIQLLRRKIENHIIMSEDFRRSYEDWLDSLNVEVNDGDSAETR